MGWGESHTPSGGNRHNPGGRGLGEIPRAELEGMYLAAERERVQDVRTRERAVATAQEQRSRADAAEARCATIEAENEGLRGQVDTQYAVIQQLRAVLGEQEATPPENLADKWYPWPRGPLPAAAPQGEAEPPKGAA